MTIAPLTAAELAARTRRAVAAATEAGKELGLAVRNPQVLHDMFSVVVHLAPAPVVARVPVVLPPGLDPGALSARQARELDVVTFLSERGVPVVRPSPRVPRAPAARDGFSITFWELAELDRNPAQPDYTERARRVPALHAALREYAGELPFLAPISTTVPACLAFLERHPGLLAPADYERLQQEWAVLGPVLCSREAFSAAFPNATVQPIHGDAPAYNLLQTRSGIRYADFEDVTAGPVEWDLALLGPEAAREYDAAAARAGVRRLDPEALRVMDAARMLQFISCMALTPVLPVLADGLAPSLVQWRTMPLAGGMSRA